MAPQVQRVQPPTERKRTIPVTKNEHKLLYLIRYQAKRCTEPVRIQVIVTRQQITWEIVKTSN